MNTKREEIMNVFYGGIDNLFLWILMMPMIIGFIYLMAYKEKEDE